MYWFSIVTYVALIKESLPNKDILSLHDRVDALKKEIVDEIIEKQKKINLKFHVTEPGDFSDNYEYIDVESQPITPIMDFDERKIKGRYKLRQLKTSPSGDTTKRVHKHHARKGEQKIKELPKEDKKKLNLLRSKPIDVFYRRQIIDMNEPSEWAHCQDLITPHLNGMKSDIKHLKRLTSKDADVTRLIYLLSMNTTDLSKDEIYSIMYQISNIQIRLFQWDVTAIHVLMNVIVKGAGHNFRQLKHGLKELFASWYMDMSNTTNLLKQARIFRPPCVKISEYDGSTKTSRTFRYTKSVKVKKCPDYDDECQDT